jgi:hypothetical protein
MTTFERNDDQARDLGPDHPQRLLIMAYTRLMLLPKQADGTRATWITTARNCELRLLEMPLPGRADAYAFLVELFDCTAGRTIDSKGCRDLNESGAVTESFLALVQRQQAAVTPRCFDPLKGEFVEVPLGGGLRHRT